MKIIVVDDEPLVKQYIVQCVRDAGGENEITAAVTSGAKVLQEMKANPADVVFADITMPKMDGIELLQELQRQYPSTAVIMLPATMILNMLVRPCRTVLRIIF